MTTNPTHGRFEDILRPCCAKPLLTGSTMRPKAEHLLPN